MHIVSTLLGAERPEELWFRIHSESSKVTEPGPPTALEGLPFLLRTRISA